MKQQLKAHEKTHEGEFSTSHLTVKAKPQSTGIHAPTPRTTPNRHSINGHSSNPTSKPITPQSVPMKNVTVEFSRMPNASKII
jgi:hypothetical protein